MKACIHVLGDAGYVWDADGEPGIAFRICKRLQQEQAPCRRRLLPPLPPRRSLHVHNTAFVLASLPPTVAHWLRLECGIVGAMVGGVASERALPVR